MPFGVVFYVVSVVFFSDSGGKVVFWDKLQVLVTCRRDHSYIIWSFWVHQNPDL